MTKTALVCGAGGFIGGHLVERLVREGYRVRGVDLKRPEFRASAAHEFLQADLRDPGVCRRAVADTAEVYQLAADMGGAGYIFTGDHDADVMRNSATVNLNMVEACRAEGVEKVFFSSSACIYPAHNQEDPERPDCSEASAYPARPDSEYGWEKLFSERLYLAYARNHGLAVRIARFHNIFGPYGAWNDGREKAPAAVCRKVAAAPEGGEIEIWGDGKQTRSFLYVDECVEGVRRLMESDFEGPVNIGSDEMVSIDRLVEIVSGVAEKHVRVRHVPGPLGVRGRTSDNRLCRERLSWAPSAELQAGLERTYPWIREQVEMAGVGTASTTASVPASTHGPRPAKARG